MTTIFEWDKDKSASNFAKHGIDFVTAQKIWTDPFLLEIPARTTDEPRERISVQFAKEESHTVSLLPFNRVLLLFELVLINELKNLCCVIRNYKIAPLKFRTMRKILESRKKKTKKYLVGQFFY